MSNHNYSQYSNNKKKKNYNEFKTAKFAEQMSVADEVDIIETITTVEAPVEPMEVKMVVEHSEIAPKVEASVTGVVVGCAKLNVRSKPAVDADVLTILDVSAEIVIDPARSTNEWVKVTTASGIDGFCMRKFVKTKA